MKLGFRILNASLLQTQQPGIAKSCTRRQKSWVLISFCDGQISLSLSFPPCDLRSLNKRILSWEQETGILLGCFLPFRGDSHQPSVNSNILASCDSCQNRLCREPQGLGSKGV